MYQVHIYIYIHNPAITILSKIEEKRMERSDSSENPMGENNIDFVNEFSLMHDFMEVPDFEQLIDIIRAESGVYNDNINHFSADDYYQHGGSGPIYQLPFEAAAAAATIAAPTTAVYDPSLLFDSLIEDMGEEHQEGDKLDREMEYSSGGTTNIAAENNGVQRKRKSGSNTTTTQKGDRSKTLISERRRRGRMKEKLYELRALVPNITKMDKASIIGDAALYVQELQMRAKKLKAQIVSLEESEADRPQEPFCQPTKKTKAVNSYSIAKTITKMEVVQVGERGFYVQLVCNKGQGVAVSLYKALESFTNLRVESSNLVTVDETFELKFTLNVGKLEVNSANLKLWVAGVFLNYGFEFKTSSSP